MRSALYSSVGNIVRPSDFGPFGGRIWLNCAHQGPLPRVAIKAARDSLAQKVRPYLIKDDDFSALPLALKASIGHLVGANADDVILGNSTSYGLHVLRNGIDWKAGDEILLANNDFPATIYPWLALREAGVKVRLLSPSGLSLSAAEVERAITPSTRLLCISWVNSFNGSVLDISSVGRVCREHGVMFVLNGSQGVGARKIELRSSSVDALVSCGYKWLCGPYATGFCWVKPGLRRRLKPTQTYWLPHSWGREDLTDYSLKHHIGSQDFDVFCTANFLDFVPWKAAIDYINSVGIGRIEEHNNELVDRMVSGVESDRYIPKSPVEHDARSAIVVLTHREGSRRNSKIHSMLANSGIDVALRNGNLRLSFHLYNKPVEVDRVISVLNSLRN